jgi:Holliday junction DNA helicase RuvA
MIAGLRGTVHKTLSDAILLDVGGVVYRVNSSTRSIAELGEASEEVFLHTHLVVREDAMMLFGFTSEAELSKLSPEQLIAAIADEDLTLLSTVSGVGKRTASRILLDLRGKLPEDLDGPKVARITVEEAETIAALRALGYTAAESQTAVARIDLASDATPEERVIAALRQLGTPV